MGQRLQFVTGAVSDRFTMTELGERYGVGRRIGHKSARPRAPTPASTRPPAPGVGPHRDRGA